MSACTLKLNAYEVDDLRHLDLCEDTATLVVAEVGCVTDGEGIWPLHSYFAWFASVQLCHTLHFAESDEVAILETVASFVQAGYNAILILHICEQLPQG